MSVYNITVIANHTKHSRITSILSLLQGWKAIRLARPLVHQSWQPRNDAGGFVGFALSGICLDKGLRFCHESSLSRKWVDRYLWETNPEIACLRTKLSSADICNCFSTNHFPCTAAYVVFYGMPPIFTWKFTLTIKLQHHEIILCLIPHIHVDHGKAGVLFP